jgi:hypothetical protein
MKRFPAAAIAFPNNGISPSSRFARNRTVRGNADRSIGMSTVLWWFATRTAPPGGRLSIPSTRSFHPPTRRKARPHHAMTRPDRSSPGKNRPARIDAMEDPAVRRTRSTDRSAPRITNPPLPGS